ncbi:MAG TPA: hypothetical protein VKZ76_01740 [Edaphocola sp.]|nr:hypothetical protein [Edaphocola sp.]
MKRVYFTLCAIIGMGIASAQAQQFNNTQLAARAQEFTEEAEQGCPQYMTPGHVSVAAELLARVEIKTEPIAANENYPLLSNVQLRNKCNPNMQRDENNFDPNNFNPLKYFFNFTPGVSTTYRVNNSNYLIVIHP